MGASGDLFGNEWSMGHAIGLTAYSAIVVAQSDNLIRLFLQKKMANIHPLITIFGVVIGLSLFGFMGVIFGPLLLSIFMLCVNLFKIKYLDTNTTTEITSQNSTQTDPSDPTLSDTATSQDSIE